MSIRVLHTEWSNGWGGQEIRIIEEMKAMRQMGVDSRLACREEALIARKARKNGFEVYTLPFRGNTDLSTLFSLISIIRREKIDIVNTHSGKDTWVGGLAARMAGARFIRTRHLSNPINPSRLNFINSLADYVITTGESVRRDMIDNNRIAPQKIVSIPTGIDEKRFDPACCTKEEARARFSLPRNGILIGIVAVLRSFKRHDIFLRCASRIASKYPQSSFVIAGDGPQRRHIEGLIEEYGLQERVYMTGHVDRVEELMRALDIFVLSSDSKEGVPQSVMQALMLSLPVVATDAGSTADLYRDGNFIMVEAGDEDSLAEAVETLLLEPSLAERLSSKARESVMEFRRSEMARRVMEVYRSVLDGKKR
jgi:glycosyltransferase involved in cell wall biosynthesis